MRRLLDRLSEVPEEVIELTFMFVFNGAILLCLVWTLVTGDASIWVWRQETLLTTIATGIFFLVITLRRLCKKLEEEKLHRYER